MNLVANLQSPLAGLYNIFAKDEFHNTLTKLSDSKLIGIANEINNIMNDTCIQLPRLVVVGTQSSGKSSVLNSIISMDILPTGKLMTTRTPLELNLIKTSKNNSSSYVEFGYYQDGKWIQEITIPITVPVPTVAEVDAIRSHIQKKTIELCGNNMNISSMPIILNVFSPYVPDLSLVDLPGLTMVACEDKGQPFDIKERIEELVKNYITNKQTIIMAVMQARADLETDLGLALIKKYDKDGSRTIGVLTKPDLMNYDSHVGDYLLTGKISKNLTLAYGYYLLKNRNDQQSKDYDILSGFKLETEYFNGHNEYKKIQYKNKLGITNLTDNLTKILVQTITEVLPVVMTELLSLESKVTHTLIKMGNDLPVTKEGKVSVLNKYVSNFCGKFIDSLESRGNPVFNAGKKIKDIFAKYKQDSLQIKPFIDANIYDEHYFANIISSLEGNHMSCYTPPIQILEATMSDINNKPIMKLKDPSLKCLDNMCAMIIELVQILLDCEEFKQYPPLANHIMNKFVDEIITVQKVIIADKIYEIICNEESYMWTDDKTFDLVLKNATEKENLGKHENIIILLEAYYDTVKYNVCHNVPKIIMNFMIRYIENNLMTFLFKNIVTDEKTELLREDIEIDKQRKYYTSIKSRIDNVKKSLNKLSE